MIESIQQGLYFTRSGEDHLDSGKPPVILLHGLFGMGRNLGAVARALSDQYAVFSFDLPNHGRSPHSDAMTISSMADDVLDSDFCGHFYGIVGAVVIDQNHLIDPIVRNFMIRFFKCQRSFVGGHHDNDLAAAVHGETDKRWRSETQTQRRDFRTFAGVSRVPSRTPPPLCHHSSASSFSRTLVSFTVGT